MSQGVESGVNREVVSDQQAMDVVQRLVDGLPQTHGRSDVRITPDSVTRYGGGIVEVGCYVYCAEGQAWQAAAAACRVAEELVKANICNHKRVWGHRVYVLLSEEAIKGASGADVAQEPPVDELVRVARDRVWEDVDDAGGANFDGGAPEQAEIDPRLVPLVVEPIDALSEEKRTIRGRVYSGEKIARAIPDVEAFLAEVGLQSQDGILLDFFELNGEGQLVMKDDCPEAYGLGENALQARRRQARIVYTENGQTQVMTGEEYFNVTEQDGEGRPLKMEVSEAAKRIDQESILMTRGLPTLKWDGKKHTGEYARMNTTGQLERVKYTWTDDDSLDDLRARVASWNDDFGVVYSYVNDSSSQRDGLGSRGVLRVYLNLEGKISPGTDFF